MSAVLEKKSSIKMEVDLGDRESIYQPEQKGLIFPESPKFTDVKAHRQHLKERLVGACRAFALQGFDYGFAALMSAFAVKLLFTQAR